METLSVAAPGSAASTFFCHHSGRKPPNIAGTKRMASTDDSAAAVLRSMKVRRTASTGKTGATAVVRRNVSQN